MLSEALFFISLVFAVTLHEFSHAWVAYRLGDPTARSQGRLTFNPFAHIDILGALMFLFVHIGWGKPVPVNLQYFQHPKRDSSFTALAGPAMNFLMALGLAVILRYAAVFLPQQVVDVLSVFLDVNVALFVFNILPFPPLDGSKVIGIFIPSRYRSLYDRYLEHGMFYFFLFLLFDQFILVSTFHVSILQQMIAPLFVLVKSLLFLGV